MASWLVAGAEVGWSDDEADGVVFAGGVDHGGFDGVDGLAADDYLHSATSS